MNSFKKISKELYIENRKKLIDKFISEVGNDGIILLQGGSELFKYDTTRKFDFYQESYFKYLFGADIPNCIGIINLRNKTSFLLIEKPTDYDILVNYYGDRNNASIKEKYGIDKMYYSEIIESLINIINPPIIYTLPNISPRNPDLKKILDKYLIDNRTLKIKLDDCRVIKSQSEIDILIFVNNISCNAHIKTMKYCKSGISECDLGNYFCYISQQLGCQYQAYQPICAQGIHSKSLHYASHMNIKDDDTILRDGEIVLVDMGAEYNGYIADITCVYPVSNSFNGSQILLYQAVLDIHDAIINMIKPDISWFDLVNYCQNQIFYKLQLLGIINDYELNYENYIPQITNLFMPHSLGHFIGLDCHDVGELDGRHNILKKGMCLAIEPGIYLREDYLKISEFASVINFDVIDKFINDCAHGVRIESNIIITSSANYNMTQIPRSIEEITKIINLN